jgi:hypothetical protein
MNFILEEKDGKVMVTVSVRPRTGGYLKRDTVSTKEVLSFLEEQGKDTSKLVIEAQPKADIRNYHGGAGVQGQWIFAKKKVSNVQKKSSPLKRKVPKVNPNED